MGVKLASKAMSNMTPTPIDSTESKNILKIPKQFAILFWNGIQKIQEIDDKRLGIISVRIPFAVTLP